MTTSKDQLSGWTEQKRQNTSQSQTYTRKGSWLLFGGLLLVWPTTAFWIPVRPLHLRSMLSKSTRCTKNSNICSQHRSTERAQFFSTATPNHCTSNTSKAEQTRRWSFASFTIFTWPLANHHFFKHLDNFLHGERFHNQQDAENVFQEFIKSRSNLFLIGKMCCH